MTERIYQRQHQEDGSNDMMRQGPWYAPCLNDSTVGQRQIMSTYTKSAMPQYKYSVTVRLGPIADGLYVRGSSRLTLRFTGKRSTPAYVSMRPSLLIGLPLQESKQCAPIRRNPVDITCYPSLTRRTYVHSPCSWCSSLFEDSSLVN